MYSEQAKHNWLGSLRRAYLHPYTPTTQAYNKLLPLIAAVLDLKQHDSHTTYRVGSQESDGDMGGPLGQTIDIIAFSGGSAGESNQHVTS